MLQRTRKTTRRCNFCTNNGDKKLTYVFPIPDPDNPGQVVSNIEGGYACEDCLPGVRTLQIEYGLVIDIEGGKK